MTTATANLTEHLSALVGAEFVFAEGDTCRVLPASTEEVSAVMSFADRHGITVQPIGGGTKIAWRKAPPAGIRLSLARMNRVLDHPWQDLVCLVQAGCSWENMQQELAKFGQFVALDPIFPAQATVGGVLATNDSGAIRHRYGSLRDLVIGMTIVLADGTIARSGGRVVKNVAGYDLPKLLTGSQGTLAIITEANFRLYPLPQHLESYTIVADSAAKLAPLMQTIRHSHLLTQALQIRGDASGFRLDIQLNVHPEARQSEILAQMVQAQGLSFQTALPETWLAREALFRGEASTLKITCLPSEVAGLVQQVVHRGGSAVGQSLGLIYAALPKAQTDFKTSGSVTVLHAPSQHIDQNFAPADSLPLMRAVKQQFDPNQTLGGI